MSTTDDPSRREASTGARRRLRVLEVCGSAAGGVRTHLSDCARLLAADGHDVIVEAPQAVVEAADFTGCRTEELDIGPRPSHTDLLVVARLRRLGRRADVVHAHGLRAGGLAALALGRRRTGRARLVVTEHNLPVGGRVIGAVGERLAGLVSTRADLVLAVSPDLAARARARGALAVGLAVVPAGPRDRRGTAPAASSVESAWKGADQRVLTVARLAPQKGLELLLDAAEQLRRLREERAGAHAGRLCWAVAGSGPLEQVLAERIADQELPVRLLGRREDVPAMLSAADVVVQTSLWEGQPITVQEALRAGAAMVATDVGGTAATARGGVVLVPAEASGIATAVDRLLADPEELSRARLRAQAAAAGLPSEADLLAQLRRDVIGDSRPGRCDGSGESGC